MLYRHFISNRHKLFLCEQVELEATTKELGTTLRAPTSEAGLAPACKDTCFGELRLQLWERKYDGSKGKVHYFSYFRYFFRLAGWVLGLTMYICRDMSMKHSINLCHPNLKLSNHKQLWPSEASFYPVTESLKFLGIIPWNGITCNLHYIFEQALLMNSSLPASWQA